MAAQSDRRQAKVEIGSPISARPSASPGNMMMIGASDDKQDVDDPSDKAGELLTDEEKGRLTCSVREVRQIVREELAKSRD